MRTLRLIVLLGCVVCLLVLFNFATLKAESNRAPQNAPAGDKAIPAACNLQPVMPPSSNPQAFETALYAFLQGDCYDLLGWARDKNLRDTGPFINMPPLANAGSNFGTHPAVRIYYSPQVMTWMNGGRKGSIADGGIIVKEMHNPPASQNNDISGWTVMVRDSKGSWDGWYWSYAGNPPAADPTNEGNTQFPNSGFGNYCINCHASTDNPLSTFIAERNILGKEMTYLVVNPSMDDPKKQERPPDLHAIHAHQAAVRPQDVQSESDKLFLKFLTNADTLTPAYPYFPGETWDHVVSGTQPKGPEQFITSDQCIGCHDATQNMSAPPNMIYPASGGDGNQPSINLSAYGEWRAGMMGLAGRDPVFFAQLASERSIHDQNPDLPKKLQNLCLSCHGVMGQRQFHLDLDNGGDSCSLTSPTAKNCFLSDFIYQWQPNQQYTKYAGLARDGVSCTVCHHIAAEGLGKPETFTGRFKVGPPNELNGPFQQPLILPMNQALGIKPVTAPQVQSSALCGSCHTILLPVFNNKGVQVGQDWEQTTYLEWLNSVYQNEIKPFGGSIKTCQDCHMPSTFQMKGYAPQDLEYRIASIEDNTFPFVDNRAPDPDITLQSRSPYHRHTLVGMNLFVLKMFEEFPTKLGIRRTDPMATYGNPVEGLHTSQNAALELAREQTVKVEVVSINKTDKTLDVTVKVTNEAGHLFPSGVSFRRAFIDFELLGQDGKPLWASGMTNQYGAIVQGTTSNVLPTEFFDPGPNGQQYQPHYQKITSQSQVQIYEELMKDPQGVFTTSFVSLDKKVKNNRLQPRGWSPKGPFAYETAPDPNTAQDPNYNNGSGTDVITYSVPLSELKGTPVSVSANVFYQTIPPYYLRQRFTDSHFPDTYRLMALTSELKVSNTPVRDWKLRVAGVKQKLP
jgi:hypothetical protein